MNPKPPLSPFSESARSIVVGWYRHYRGGRYEVIGLGRHSETLEEVVVYRREGAEEFWVRPVSNWLEDVEFEGQAVPRFVIEQFV